MNAKLIYTDTTTLLQCLDAIASRWLARQPEVTRLHRQNVGGELMVNGDRATIESLSRRMCSTGRLNVMVGQEAA